MDEEAYRGSEAFQDLCRKLGWSTPPDAKPRKSPRRWTAADDRKFNAEYHVWLSADGPNR